MRPTFNLIDKPFIPCVMNGEVTTLSLLDAFLRAHYIKEVRDSSPLVTVALHRLMLAILHRALGGPDSAEHWKQLWDENPFDCTPIETYLAKWNDHFDLFHERYPFFQDVAFTAKAKNGVNQMVRELSRGNNATLFDHTHEEPPPILSHDAIARSIIAEQMFAVGGGKSELGYTSSGPAAAGVIVLIRGQTLFETLMLNLMGYGEDWDYTFNSEPGRDKPSWERDIRPSADKIRADGYVDYLTWQSRSIRLLPEENGSVQYMYYAAGRKYEPPANVCEPMTTHTRDENDTTAEPRMMRLSETKDLWRDSSAFFEFTNEKQFRPSDNLRWIRTLIHKELIPKGTYTISAIGLCTAKAKVNFWRQETLPLPLDYLTDDNLVTMLKIAIGIAEEIGLALRMSVATFAKLALTADPKKSPDKNRQWQMVDAVGADALYWSRLEAPFREFLVNLPSSTEHQREQFHAWFSFLKRTASKAYREAAELPQLDGRGQRAAIDGESQLLRSIGKIRNQHHIPKEVPL